MTNRNDDSAALDSGFEDDDDALDFDDDYVIADDADDDATDDLDTGLDEDLDDVMLDDLVAEDIVTNDAVAGETVIGETPWREGQPSYDKNDLIEEEIDLDDTEDEGRTAD